MTIPQDKPDSLDEMLASFIMQYDQKIKIGNKRNIEATERAKAALLHWRDTQTVEAVREALYGELSRNKYLLENNLVNLSIVPIDDKTTFKYNQRDINRIRNEDIQILLRELDVLLAKLRHQPEANGVNHE